MRFKFLSAHSISEFIMQIKTLHDLILLYTLMLTFLLLNLSWPADSNS